MTLSMSSQEESTFFLVLFPFSWDPRMRFLRVVPDSAFCWVPSFHGGKTLEISVPGQPPCSGGYCMEGQQNQQAHQVAYPVIFPSPAGKNQEWFHYLLPWLFNNYLLQVGLWLARGKSWIFSNLSQTKVLILRWCGQWMNRKTSGVRMASAQTLGRSVEQRMLPGLIGKRPNTTFQKEPLYLGFILSWIYTDKEIPFILNRFWEIWK